MLEDLLLERNYHQVVYLGDGKGDFCPCSRLGPSDSILARQTYPDGSACALLKLLLDSGGPITASRQCPSTKGPALQGTPIKSDGRSPPWPMGKAAKHTEAGDGSRGEQPAGSLPEQDDGGLNSQGKAKRHKAEQKAEQQKVPDVPLSQHSQPSDTGVGSLGTAGLDIDRCQAGKDDNNSDATNCTEGTQLPLPPLVDRDGAAGSCRSSASVYSWTTADEAAEMLHALLHHVLG